MMSTAPTRLGTTMRSAARRRPGREPSSTRRNSSRRAVRVTGAAGPARLRAPRALRAAAADRHDRRRPHAERVLGIPILEEDSHGDAVGEPDPVERLAHGGEAADGSAVLLVYGPSDPLDDTPEAAVRIAHQIDVGGHARADRGEEGLAEIRHHVPRPVVDEGEDLLPLARVLADGDVQIGDV